MKRVLTNLPKAMATVLFFTALVATAQDRLSLPDAPITARVIEGGGQWKTEGLAAKSSQRWDLQLTRGDDDTLTGRVTLGDSPLATSANVHGRLVGRTLTGRLIDDEGNYVASFEGTIGIGRMSGSYTDRTGESGTWEWEGPPPK